MESHDKAKLPSLPYRLFQVLVAPGELFTALRSNPAWGGALLVGAALVAVSALLIPLDLLLEGAREQLLSQGRPVPPAFESTGGIIRVFSVIGPLIAWPVWTFVLAGIAWLVFGALGGGGNYRQYLSVVSHALFIAALGTLLVVPLKIFQGDLTLNLSLASFAYFLEDGYLLRVLRLLDLFALWGYAIMAIGVTKIDPRRGLGVALTFFFGFAVVFAAVFGIFGG
jgi:hypothetical protein